MCLLLILLVEENVKEHLEKAKPEAVVEEVVSTGMFFAFITVIKCSVAFVVILINYITKEM